jgi:hypothetical protein
MHNRGPGEDCRIRPVFAENRPQRLIVILGAAEERTSQYRFLDRADLAQCPIAAAVFHRSTRLEAMRAEYVKGKVDRLESIVKPHSALPNAGSSERI